MAQSCTPWLLQTPPSQRRMLLANGPSLSHGLPALILSARCLRERNEGSGIATDWPPTSGLVPPLPSAVGKKVSKSISSCIHSEDVENAAHGNRESRLCESKQGVPSHAVLLQGMWLHAARACERDWDVRRVQLQVQRSAATHRGSPRGCSAHRKAGPGRKPRRRRIYLSAEHPT